ncbi:MAG: hypothetical protein K5773_03620 [Pseudobutyrivibrio sp.]|nr:hypothetical protein [Pseudobutyrivibrio sp.]
MFNFENEDIPYSSDDAQEDLDKIRDIIHDAMKRINRDKLDKSDIDFSVNIKLKED